MLLVVSDPRFADHDTGRGHPERPARLDAVELAVGLEALTDAIVEVRPDPAPKEKLIRVHDADHVERLLALSGTSGAIDGDTPYSGDSIAAAKLAAGAGLKAIEEMESGAYSAAFCAVRPPGHHATPNQSMGFCLLNNVAVTAAELAGKGERVAILDFDAHHGNGTQDIFWDDPSVFYFSWHQWPNFPGTGLVTDVGGPTAQGTTMNLPFTEGTTAPTYLDSIERVVGPAIERFDPTWLLISAGFDGHTRDPLCGLRLDSGDFGLMTENILQLAPSARVISFLEGGYDLQGLAEGTASHLSALIGERMRMSESPRSDSGQSTIKEARAVHGL